MISKLNVIQESNDSSNSGLNVIQETKEEIVNPIKNIKETNTINFKDFILISYPP